MSITTQKKIVLMGKNRNGDIVYFDALDIRSTWDNIIIDHEKIGIPSFDHNNPYHYNASFNFDNFYQRDSRHDDLTSGSDIDLMSTSSDSSPIFDNKTPINKTFGGTTQGLLTCPRTNDLGLLSGSTENDTYNKIGDGSYVDYDVTDDGTILEYEQPYIEVGSRSEIGRKRTDKSIFNDMSNFQIPDDIKYKADEIYSGLKLATKRGKRRRKVIFFCMFQAYQALGRPCDPKKLANVVGINPNEISKAFSLCSPLETGYYPSFQQLNFVDFIPTYYHLTGLSESNLEDVIELGQSLSTKDTTLLDELPQIVAVSTLLYYMEINGVSCNTNFSDKVGRSELTLSQMKKRIESIDN